uniref:Uncharacterized protein n=1 Tax=Sphaerodactylus townsendi TaxID=933632 RepID=A0ACB8G5U6_9SAUR
MSVSVSEPQINPPSWPYLAESGLSNKSTDEQKIRAYVGALAPDYDESADLTALRFFSVNSIVDPWVFIIFRTAVFRTCLHRVSRTLSYKRSLDSQLLETSTRKDSGQLQ